MAAKTIQTNIKSHNQDDLTKYALFLGGLDVTHDVLQKYDPFRRGYARIFMVRQPLFVLNALPDQMKKFKHILEWANTSIGGVEDITVGTSTMEGGYAGRAATFATSAEDPANQLTIGTYEFSGSPLREVLHYWVTGVFDLQSGFATYHDSGDEYSYANHTAEFVYVVTDPTGKNVEYACLWANCFPTNIPMDHLNYESGQHDLVPVTLNFTGTKYESPQINKVAVALLDKYQVLTDSLEFHSKLTSDDIVDLGSRSSYNINNGQINWEKDENIYSV